MKAAKDTGKTAVICGGLGALGQAVAVELLARDYQVALIDVASAPEDNRWTILGGVDLVDSAAVEAAFRQLMEAFGSINFLVNAAGGFAWELMSEGREATWRQMLDINVMTTFNCCRNAIPYLVSPGGAIVNVAAWAVVNPSRGMAAYAASKAAVRALSESLADELRSRDVRVNCLLPTILDTPANRRAMPEADTDDWVDLKSAARLIGVLGSNETLAMSGASVPLNRRG